MRQVGKLGWSKRVEAYQVRRLPRSGFVQLIVSTQTQNPTLCSEKWGSIHHICSPYMSKDSKDQIVKVPGKTKFG